MTHFMVLIAYACVIYMQNYQIHDYLENELSVTTEIFELKYFYEDQVIFYNA